MREIWQKTAPTLVIFLFFFLAFFAYTKLFGPLPLTVNNVNTNKNDIFAVTGEGKVVVKPDIAYVTVGFEASGTSVKEVQTQANAVNQKIVTALKKVGVEEKDIKTTSYNIQPTFDWGSGRQKITGYTANTSLQVKVRDIDRVNEVIDGATAAGANQVGGVTFDVDDKSQYEEAARKEAVAEAKKKAQDAAKAAGFRLGKMINYSETSTGYLPRPVNYAAGEAVKLDSAVSTQVQTGSTEIKITVTLSYVLE